MASGNQSDTHLLRPEDVAADELPVAVRGYDRHAVDRRLARVADSYARLLRQRDELREWLEAAEARVAAAQDEAKLAAREVAALTQRRLGADEELSGLRRRVGELEAALDEAGRKPAPVSTIPEGKAAELLLAARSASEQLRRATREEARLVLRKAQARADAVSRDADRQHRALDAAAERTATLTAKAEQQQRAVEEATARVAALSSEAESQRRSAEEARVRRVDAEREARRLVEQARADAEQALAALANERRRVHTMLGQALEALEVEEHTGDVLADLSSRLRGGEGPAA